MLKECKWETVFLRCGKHVHQELGCTLIFWSFTSLMKYEDSMSRVQPVSSDCKNQLWLHRLFMWRFLPLSLSLSLFSVWCDVYAHLLQSPSNPPLLSPSPDVYSSTQLFSTAADVSSARLSPYVQSESMKKGFFFFFFFWAVQLAFETSVFPFRGLLSDWGGCWVSCSEIVHSDALCVAADGK